MRIYRSQNVLDAALDRIRWLFDEFPNVVVSVSGGKDSTVVFHLALQVAREKGRLPLKVMWLDQEAEWQATVDTVREMMYRPDVEPYWYQIPIRLFNATSATDHWLRCWDPEQEARWVHPHDPISIKVNPTGQDRFAKMFEALARAEFGGVKTAYVAGVRTQESPNRYMGLTYQPTYKWVTWGTKLHPREQHFTFYPIYDWSYLDVWKAIFEHDWPYNRLYDAMYRYGIPVPKMRVSNVHHETAVNSLFFMQEVEPETHNRLTARLAGIDGASKLGAADYFVSELPFMFSSWQEYRDYLLVHIVDDPDWRERFRKRFEQHDRTFGTTLGDKMYREHVRSILLNDWEGITLGNLNNRAGSTLGAKRALKAARIAEEAGTAEGGFDDE